MRMPHQPTATLSPSLIYPHRHRYSIPFYNFLTLSSFHCFIFLSCPFSHVSLFFFPFASLRSNHYSAFCFSLSLSLSFSVYYSFFFFFSKHYIYIFFPLFLFHSRFQILYLLLSKSYLFVWFLIGFLCAYFYYLYGYIRRDSNYIIAAVTFISNKKVVRSISALLYLFLS